MGGSCRLVVVVVEVLLGVLGSSQTCRLARGLYGNTALYIIYRDSTKWVYSCQDQVAAQVGS
jgi:hypothetical protein